MNSMQSGVLEILKHALAGLPVSEQQATFAYWSCGRSGSRT
jgi:hypothetical protein